MAKWQAGERAQVFEIQFTSAPTGLIPGKSGFCTVKATRDIPTRLREVLEGLSSFRTPAGSSGLTAPALTHVTIDIGGRAWHVLSRVAPAGLDYTGRGNLFAHHVALQDGELPGAGPAWLADHPRVFGALWDGRVGYMPPRAMPDGEDPPRVCRTWEVAFGDAGWAGASVEAVLEGKPVTIAYRDASQVMSLVREAVALLPPNRRWRISFSTCFTSAVSGVECSLRGVPAESKEHRQAKEGGRGILLEGGSKLRGCPEGSLVETARSGRAFSIPPRQAVSRTVPQAATPANVTELPASRRAEPILFSPDLAQGSSAPAPRQWLLAYAAGLTSGLVVAAIGVAAWSSLAKPQQAPVVQAAATTPQDQQPPQKKETVVKEPPPPAKQPSVVQESTDFAMRMLGAGAGRLHAVTEAAKKHPIVRDVLVAWATKSIAKAGEDTTLDWRRQLKLPAVDIFLPWDKGTKKLGRLEPPPALFEFQHVPSGVACKQILEGAAPGDRQFLLLVSNKSASIRLTLKKSGELWVKPDPDSPAAVALLRDSMLVVTQPDKSVKRVAFREPPPRIPSMLKLFAKTPTWIDLSHAVPGNVPIFVRKLEVDAGAVRAFARENNEKWAVDRFEVPAVQARIERRHLVLISDGAVSIRAVHIATPLHGMAMDVAILVPEKSDRAEGKDGVDE